MGAQGPKGEKGEPVPVEAKPEKGHSVAADVKPVAATKKASVRKKGAS
jgi:hypothetical protein